MLFVETEQQGNIMELPHVMAAKVSSEEVSVRSMPTAAGSTGTAWWTRTRETSAGSADSRNVSRQV